MEPIRHEDLGPPVADPPPPAEGAEAVAELMVRGGHLHRSGQGAFEDLLRRGRRAHVTDPRVHSLPTAWPEVRWVQGWTVEEAQQQRPGWRRAVLLDQMRRKRA